MAGESRDISRGTKITAAQFNDLIRRYNEFWKGLDYEFDGEHSTDLVRRRGWGQPADVYREVARTEIITASHINHLIAQMNVGIYHIDETEALLSKYSAQAAIEASNYEMLVAKMDEFFDVHKYEAEDIGEYIAPAITIYNEDGSTPWNDDLVSEFKHTFTDYNTARHYFNSGGQLTISLDAVIHGPQDTTWKEIFDSIGDIRIGAIESVGTGINQGMCLEAGFYDLISTPTTPAHPDYPHPYPWRTVYEASGSVYMNASGEYCGEYTGEYYVHGEYNSRRVRVEMRAEENSVTGRYELHTRVTLIEDEDDTFPMTVKVTAEVGFMEVFDTPEPTDPNLSFFTAGTTVYGFTSPENPTVETTLNWTPVDVQGVLDDVQYVEADYVESEYLLTP